MFVSGIVVILLQL